MLHDRDHFTRVGPFRRRIRNQYPGYGFVFALLSPHRYAIMQKAKVSEVCSHGVAPITLS
jgi:hypothetical protein